MQQTAAVRANPDGTAWSEIPATEKIARDLAVIVSIA